MEKEKERANRIHILVVPLPVQGHINPMLQFSKRLAAKGLRVTLVTISSNTEAIETQLCKVNIEPIHATSEEEEEAGNNVENKVLWFQTILSRRLPQLILKQENDGYPIICLVYDSAMPWVLDTAKGLGIFGASFFTHSCAVGAVYYNVHEGLLRVPLKEPTISLPGLPLLEPQDLPSFIYDPGSYPSFLNLVVSRFSNISGADWIFFNTFHGLEKEFHGVRAQCLNIRAGMEIPDKKLLKYALQYIRGIGRARAGLLISQLNMTNKLAEDLTRREVAAIGEEISNYLVGRELAIVVEGDIKRMKDISVLQGDQAYNDKLPGRGQRTSTNSSTEIARTRIAVASSNKVKNK